MRVLQVHKDFEPNKGGGGTARHIHGLGIALVSKGCEVRVVAPDAEAVNAPYQSVVTQQADLAQHVAWADIVHVHGARSHYAVSGAYAAKQAGKPFCYTPHAYYGGRTALNAVKKWGWDQTAERFLLSAGACTILLTDVWRQVLQQRGLPIHKTAIIPNCVTEEDLLISLVPETSTKLPGAPAILSIGRLDAVKRLTDVVEALSRTDLAQAHFHIVGKGSEKAAIETKATQLGVSNRVTLHGFVSDADVAKMIRGADVFVLASEQEGLPTVLLEMLMAKRAVACSRIPGNMAITSVAGVDTIFHVGDIDGLAREVKRAATVPVTDTQIERLKQQFTWERRVDDILGVYQAALHPKLG
jgi:glycosyltransferase involved in cell wall biosynthesis